MGTFRSALVFAYLVISVSHALAQSASDAKDSSLRSPYLVQDEIRDLRDDKDRLSIQKDSLENLLRKLDQLRTEFKTPNADVFSTRLETLRATVQTLNENIPAPAGSLAPLAPRDSEVLFQEPESDDDEAIDGLTKQVIKLQDDVYAAQSSVSRYREQLEEIDYSFERILAGEENFYPLGYGYAESVRPEPWEESLKAYLLRILNGCEEDIRELRTDLSAVSEKATGLRTRITESISKTTSELTSIESKLGESYRELDNIEQEASERQALDTKLTYAVYGMILAIVLMFASLKWFADDLSKQIIEKRVLIETLSMGFLLLTVIVLGTGRLLSGEALGAILGTIAGYIFGRKAVEQERGD